MLNLRSEDNRMGNRIIARWEDWSGAGLEHLVLTEGADEIVAEVTGKWASYGLPGTGKPIWK